MLKHLSRLVALVLCAVAWGQETPRYFEVLIPEGSSTGFSIDAKSPHQTRYYSSTAGLERVVGQSLGGIPPEQLEGARVAVRASLRAQAAPGSFWLDRGFDGVRFRGAGLDRSRLRAPPGTDQTVLVDRHQGAVLLEAVTVHAGPRQAVFFGLEHKGDPILDRFELLMRDAKVVADPPTDGNPHSTVWGLFAYQADVTLERVELDLLFSAEHASYWHGFAKYGLRWKNVKARAGAEVCKVRSSPSETDWVAGATIELRGCRIEDWFHPERSWRGGAGLVVQGSGCAVLVERCVFLGNAGNRSRCIMVDDSGGDFFGYPSGAVGVGAANGPVVVRDSGLFGGPALDSGLAILARVGNFAGSSRPCAPRVRFSRCALIGAGVQLQLGDVPAGKTRVVGCNTEAILELVKGLGYPYEPEGVIALRDRLAKISEGLVR